LLHNKSARVCYAMENFCNVFNSIAADMLVAQHTVPTKERLRSLIRDISRE